MNDPQSQEQLQVPPDQNTRPEPGGTPETGKSGGQSFMRSGSLTSLLKAAAILLGVVIIFYVGYELAVYQTEKSDTLLPHIDFTPSSDSPSGNCSQGKYYAYPPTVNPTRKVCLTPGPVDEPVIYLYPPLSEDVTVKVAYSAGLSRTVPAYNAQTGWQVLASPNSDLTNLTNGRTYPYLIWEGNPDPSLHYDMSKGFVVAGSDTRAFLQRQLPAMGLNQKETADFIAYWAPQLDRNPYNLIHFAGKEYTDAAKLTISPQPDSLLRILMVYQPLQKPAHVTPQSFPVFHRGGFTAVEWGGTELTD